MVADRAHVTVSIARGPVGRSYLLASRSMDAHLGYVAMTRHRDAAKLFYAATSSRSRNSSTPSSHDNAPRIQRSTIPTPIARANRLRRAQRGVQKTGAAQRRRRNWCGPRRRCPWPPPSASGATPNGGCRTWRGMRNGTVGTGTDTFRKIPSRGWNAWPMQLFHLRNKSRDSIIALM